MAMPEIVFMFHSLLHSGRDDYFFWKSLSTGPNITKGTGFLSQETDDDHNINLEIVYV